jgi:hypothetical protein
VPRNILDNYKSIIGPIWVDRFKKHPCTYSGLSIADLSQTIGPMYARWYDVVYAIQSGNVHASNTVRLLHFNDDIWHDATIDIEVALKPAMDIFFDGAESLHKHIDFGSAVGMLLSGLDAEYKQIRDERRNRRTR